MLQFADPWTPKTTLLYTVTRVYESFESPYQTIEVLETEDFGTVLVIGGVTNVTDRDESSYHEALAHVPLLSHPRPRRVLIIGGGDGGTLREVLRHECVEECVLVDIDAEVIRCARQYFPKLSSAMDSPRAEVIVDDGLAFVARAAERGDRYDVILVDSTDPVDAAVGLFTEPFYRSCFDALADDGILVPQSDSPTFCMPRVVEIYRTLGSIFPAVTPFTASCLTYPGTCWAFMAASKGRPLEAERCDVDRLTAIQGDLRYMNGPMFGAAFALPEYFVRALRGAPPSELPSICDTPRPND